MGCEYTCKASVTKSETLVECSNEHMIPNGFNGPFVSKIPVVLAEPIIQIDVESEIQLEEPAIEIKRIKKNLFITQCKLIDTSFYGCEKTGKLFLSGFVRKNIEYATADCTSDCKNSISGRIQHTTVNVPFTCVTKVKYVNPPKFCKKGYTQEMASYHNNMKGHDYCGQMILGSDPCEMSFQHIECFNEKVYCELEEVRIFEDDLIANPKYIGCDYNKEQTFDKIIEKMVIFVRIKLLQNQQVNIPGYGHRHDDKHKNNEKCDCE